VTRVLVTGARGQVGTELARELGDRCDLIAVDRTTLDLADAAAIRRRVREIAPAVIVNAGAYTAVDRAESEPDLAHAVNGIAPGVLAEEARASGALLVHFSTDYVFDGSKADAYVESDPVAPLSVYGRTKLAGEQAITASGCAHLTLRTSWVYGPHGKNFMLTMLRLGQERPELRVVADQRGTPNSSRQLARFVAHLLARGADEVNESAIDHAKRASGIYHASAAGAVSWHGFAQAIFEGWARRAGAAFRIPSVVPITTAEYPTPARRPANSVLAANRFATVFHLELPAWRAGLDEALDQVFESVKQT
jgi:dTDP-4-dehydrorhamnose reductase